MDKFKWKLMNSLIWLFATVAFICLSLENFLFHISNFSIYRVLSISFRDLLILSTILAIQYLLLHKTSSHINEIFLTIQKMKYPRFIFTIITIIFTLLFALLPTQIPYWTFLIVLGGILVFHFVNELLITKLFFRNIFLLVFGATVSSVLVFWMHEESNKGRHIRYAKKLAIRQDTKAEKILLDFAEIDKLTPIVYDQYNFWEKEWINNPYMVSNYKIDIEEKISDSLQTYFQPVLTFNEENVPVYKVYFPENYAITFELNTEFRKSIYSPNVPYKELKDLDDFQFVVVDKSRIILSNSYAFDSFILDVSLPQIGKSKKMELEGFDVLTYRHSEDRFVLIGEPLSEFQVGMSNFAFIFSLLILVALCLEILRLLFSKQKISDSWQELPIQFRIQIVLIGITFLLFVIIASTTFYFLKQNNESISSERLLYISETLRGEILEKEEQYHWTLDDFTVQFLNKIADRRLCDIDFYRPNGSLINSSFATAQNSPSLSKISNEIIDQLKNNPALILVERQFTDKNKKPYLRTYFGIFENNKLQGIGSASSLESEIGTTPYISVVMIKLLNVYVFLLILAWTGGLFLIGLLTKPLELLANRISNFKLGTDNKKLAWKGDDAIGQLIHEYNEMVDKVEITSQELIRNERENVWQVMAQQIAHEINNKLTPLRLNIQFLPRIFSQKLNAEQSEALHKSADGLVEKIDSLTKTVARFRLFAKLDHNQSKPIELKKYLKEYYDEYIVNKRFHYTFNSTLNEEQNPILNINPDHLSKILKNLLSNAENAIPEEKVGHISVGLAIDNEYSVVSISDNGKGIDKKVLEEIFDPKFSVTSSQTGLGLPICKRIIDFYNGKIDFKTTEGEGTEFFIYFPNEKS